MDTPKGEGKSARGMLSGGTAAVVLIALIAVIYAIFQAREGQETEPPVVSTSAEAPTAPEPALEPQAVMPATQEAAAPVEAETEAPVAETQAEAPEPVVEEPSEPADATAPETETAAAPAPAPDLAVARFDAFRASPDGMMTLAGQAEPGAQVEFLLDGKVIGSATATDRGEYAAVIEAAPSAVERLLSLRVTGADGVAREGAETLVVAPVAPVEQAMAEQAAPAPEAGAGEAADTPAAESAPAPTIVADADGARVLGASVGQLVIDTLAQQGVARGGVISGRGAPAGTVLRAYLDNAEVGLTSPAPDGSWSMEVPALTGAAQLLRIDALDAAGQVVARAEIELTPAAPVAEAATEVQDPAPAQDKTSEAEAVPAPTAAPETVPETKPATAAASEPAPVRRLTVERGNSLWAIAREVYGDGMLYVRVFEANKGQIRDPDLIYPGQTFEIPQ